MPESSTTAMVTTDSSLTTQFPPEQARGLVRAVFAIFLVNGIMMGAWGGSLPGLRDRVHTSESGIGVALLVAGACAIVSMQIGGRVSDRITPRLPCLVSGVTMALGVVIASLAPNFVTLVIAAALIGASNGSMDVAMNALGVDAEKASGVPTMSRFHAFFSLGGFIGSMLVLGLARLQDGGDVDPRLALMCAAAASAIGLAVLFVRTPRAPHTAETSDGDLAAGSASVSDSRSAKSVIPTQAWLLAVMALFFGFTEGTATDWASLHVTDVAHVDPATGAAGLICGSATMVIIRLLGDRLVRRHGRAAVVRFGAPVAVLGFAVTITSHALGIILIGWLLVGLGVGMIAPQIYAIAGHIGGGRVLAIVTAFGYTAFLAGPALIGFLSNHFGIQRAMFLPLCAGILLTLLTFTAALQDPAGDD